MRRKMIFKKVAVPVMGLLLACSVIPATTINADAYECKYVSSAPSDVNRLSFSEVGKASGGDTVTIHSTSFYTYISGAYLNVTCSSRNSNSTNVVSTGDYYVKYSGDSVPKANVSVKMSGHLKEYASSLSVDAKGTISF